MDRLINSIENLVQSASGKLQPTIILAIANLDKTKVRSKNKDNLCVIRHTKQVL